MAKKESKLKGVFEYTRDNTVITGLKTKNNKVFVDIVYRDANNNVINMPSMETERVPHPDFYKAMDKLSPYMDLIFKAENGNVHCMGFSTPKDNNIILKGKICLLDDSYVGVATSKINIDEFSEQYEFLADFIVDLDMLKEETFKYMFEEKQAQLVLPLEEESEEDNSNQIQFND